MNNWAENGFKFIIEKWIEEKNGVVILFWKLNFDRR